MGSFIRIMVWTWLALAVIVGVVSWIALEELTGTEEIVQKEANNSLSPASDEQEERQPAPEPAVILKINTTPNHSEQQNQTSVTPVDDTLNQTSKTSRQTEQARKRKYAYLIDLDSVRKPYCKKLEKEFMDKEKETERALRRLRSTEENLKQDILYQQEQVEIARNIVEQDSADYNKRALQTEKRKFEALRDNLKEAQDKIQEQEIYLRQVRQTLGAVRTECDRLEIAGRRI